ncbi:hypothetical protein OUZ56_011321 [Daphnia magna]|uniref:Uncharacterized protein n=1 Tax=Daphnia magna TaxID=35525 RepID=A0ABQ9YZT0_9CRUS|nr:hypothetical protein OUZ56_011321 [Daphnia magna]
MLLSLHYQASKESEIKPSSIHIIGNSKGDLEHPIPEYGMAKTNSPEDNNVTKNIVDNAWHATLKICKTEEKMCRIRLPTNCILCKKERSGQCSASEIVELKQVIKDKNKELKTVKGYHAKLETHLNCLKLRLKNNRKKLNTCRKKLLRLKRYSQEVVVTLGKLKEQTKTLSANQLDEKIKCLTHGVHRRFHSFILNTIYASF